MKQHGWAELGLFQHCSKDRFPMNRELHFARAPHVCGPWNFLDRHGDQFMLWNVKISEYRMKTVTNLWPVSGSHIPSLCKSNLSQRKGPAGPYFYRKENPAFTDMGQIKWNIQISKKEKEKNNGTGFHRISFSSFQSIPLNRSFFFSTFFLYNAYFVCYLFPYTSFVLNRVKTFIKQRRLGLNSFKVLLFFSLQAELSKIIKSFS